MNLRRIGRKRKDGKDGAVGDPTVPQVSAVPGVSPVRGRVAAWIDVLQRDPSAEERVAAERRALLLAELNQTIADAPDDVPIKYVIDRLNRHWDD